jgi:hypothetical protein
MRTLAIVLSFEHHPIQRWAHPERLSEEMSPARLEGRHDSLTIPRMNLS